MCGIHTPATPHSSEGKWHLGLGSGDVDWNGPVAPGPLEIGFDESFLLPATNDRAPCVFLDGHIVVGLDPSDPLQVSYEKDFGELPTGESRPEILRYPANPQTLRYRHQREQSHRVHGGRPQRLVGR